MRGQLEAGVAIEVHGAMEAAVAGLTQAEGAAAAQLPALCVVAFLRGHQPIRQGLPGAASCGMLTRRGGQHRQQQGSLSHPQLQLAYCSQGMLKPEWAQGKQRDQDMAMWQWVL